MVADPESYHTETLHSVLNQFQKRNIRIQQTKIFYQCTAARPQMLIFSLKELF